MMTRLAKRLLLAGLWHATVACGSLDFGVLADHAKRRTKLVFEPERHATRKEDAVRRDADLRPRAASPRPARRRARTRR